MVEQIEKRTSGLIGLLYGTPDVVTRISRCCGCCDLESTTEKLLQATFVRVVAKSQRKEQKTRKNKQMNKRERRPV